MALELTGIVKSGTAYKIAKKYGFKARTTQNRIFISRDFSSGQALPEKTEP